jgi:outer membrane protein assembly factor BamB
MRVTRILLVVGLMAGLLVPGVGAEASVDCANPEELPSGEWLRSGNTLDNARHQTDETQLGPDTAADVEPAWVLNPADHGMGGTFSHTPVVTGGCVYTATSFGHVMALNAKTGEVVWRAAPLPGDSIAWHANVITGSPTVTEDTVYVAVNRTGSPYVAALDRETGEVEWTTTIAFRDSNTTVPSPVYHNGLIFQGFSGFEFEEDARGGYAIVDAETGELLVHRYTIPDEDYDEGYRGAGIWCTAAIDVETSYAYACTSNPAREMEHEYTNSLLQIDLDPNRTETFGEIVGHYEGTPDSYVRALREHPACEQFGFIGMPYYSIPCFQLDLDFGASPHLFRDSDGELVVGNLQKSGVYHAVYADDMEGKWTTTIGPPCIWCNAASPAHDGEKVYTVSGLAAKMFALDIDSGLYQWVSPVGNIFHYQPVSLANGVAYTINGLGTLVGYDTETGAPVLVRSISEDGNTLMAEVNSNGVAIAYSTLYAPAGDRLIAYR